MSASINASNGGRVSLTVQMLAVEFEGKTFAASFSDRGHQYAAVVEKCAAEKLLVSQSPLLSDLGRRQALERLEKSAAREIRDLRAKDVAALEAHISSLLDGARQRAAAASSSDNSAKLLAYMERRDILEDVLRDDAILLTMHLKNDAVNGENDLVLSILDNRVLAARLARHLGRGDVAAGQEIVNAIRTARDERLAPEVADLRTLLQAYETVAATALKEIGAAAEQPQVA